MSTRSTRHRTRYAAAVIVAGSVFGVASTFAIATAEGPARPAQPDAADRVAIAEWAREQGLSGLSPASLRPVDE
jgi:hypothetical protein